MNEIRKLLVGLALMAACLIVPATSVKADENDKIRVYDQAGTELASFAYDPASDVSVLEDATHYVKAYQDATGSSEHFTIKLAAGDYYANEAINLFSHMTLDLSEGAVIHRKAFAQDGSENTAALIRFGEGDENVYGYDAYTDIAIVGGGLGALDGGATSHCILRLGHASNVTIDGVHMYNVTRMHHMEFAAIDNISITNCVFDGYIEENGQAAFYDNMEAISLDTLTSVNNFPFYYAYDGSVSANVKICNNSFVGCKRGVGSHRGDLGKYISGVEISNNYFENIEGYCISATNYKDCSIDGNTMVNCGVGIVVRTIMDDKNHENYVSAEDQLACTNHNISITNNNISLRDSAYKKTSKGNDRTMFGIEVYGENIKEAVTTYNADTKSDVTIPAGDYRIRGVYIAGNKIWDTFMGHGIWVRGAVDVTVFSNEIRFKNESVYNAGDDLRISDGICIDGSQKVKVKDNVVAEKSAKGYGKCTEGVILKNGSSHVAITGNTFSRMTKYAICLLSEDVQATVKDNLIKSPGKGRLYSVLASDSKTYTVVNKKKALIADASRNTDSGAKGVTLTVRKLASYSKCTVYRSTSKDGQFKKIGSTKTKTFVDKTAKKDKTYYYKLVPSVKVGKVKFYGAESAVYTVKGQS